MLQNTSVELVVRLWYTILDVYHCPFIPYSCRNDNLVVAHASPACSWDDLVDVGWFHFDAVCVWGGGGGCKNG